MKTKKSKLHNHRLGETLPMTPIRECIEKPDHNLVLYSLPIGAKLKGTAISVSNTGRIFFLSDQGYLYDLRKGSGISIIDKKELGCYLTRNELRAFQRLGLLTGKQVSAAVKGEKERQAKRTKRWKADEFMECAKKLGIPTREAARLVRQATTTP